MDEWERINADACAVVAKAAQFLATVFGEVRETDIARKGHNSLVSYADMESEKILVSGLEGLVANAVFLTEEATVAPQEGQWQWIIDPLDGTTNFLHGLPLFTISVALYREGHPAIGIVHDVMGGEVYHAIAGRGAWRNGERMTLDSGRALEDSLIATGFPYYDYSGVDDYLQVLASLMRRTRGIRRLGSAALDLAWTASGRFDGFFEYGLHPWDVAAGALLVREAGGSVTDFDGGGNFLHGKTIIAGREKVTEALQNEIKLYFSRV